MENASQNYMIGRLFIPMMLMNLFEAAQILYYLQKDEETEKIKYVTLLI